MFEHRASSPTAARSRCGSSAPCARLGIRSVAVYTDADPAPGTCARPTPPFRIGPAPAAESYLRHRGGRRRRGARPGPRRPPGLRLPVRERRVRPRPASAPASCSSGRRPRRSRRWATRSRAKNAVAARRAGGARRRRARTDDDDLVAAADEVGYPLLVKPSAGGGGKGMRVVDDAGRPRGRAGGRPPRGRRAFGDDTLFLERFVCGPGTSRSRCSPTATATSCTSASASAACSAATRRSSRRRRRRCSTPRPARGSAPQAAARRAQRAATSTRARSSSSSPPTPGRFFFLEMNTRLQVEHPVTEMVTGLDLVEWQLRIAAGEPLPFGPGRRRRCAATRSRPGLRRGPRRGFPADRRARCWECSSPRVPACGWTRRCLAGTTVGSDYDPMLGKVIA